MAITPKKVSRWRKRFLALGMSGLLKDAPRPQTQDRHTTDETRVTPDHAPAADQRHPLEHAHRGRRHERSQRAAHLAGANLDNGDPETLLFSMTRFFKFLPAEQKQAFLGGLGEKAS